MTLDGFFKDYDTTSADDLIGQWNTYIDLQAVAEEFKNGKNFVTREFTSSRSDSATKLIIEFFR